jgi:hypothetical protein
MFTIVDLVPIVLVCPWWQAIPSCHISARYSRVPWPLGGFRLPLPAMPCPDNKRGYGAMSDLHLFVTCGPLATEPVAILLQNLPVG